MKIPKEYERTTPDQDDIPNPYVTWLIKEAAELIQGEVEIRPSFLAELPYVTGREYYVEQLVGQNRRFAINYDLHVAAKSLVGSSEDNETVMYNAANESMSRAFHSITKEAQVGEEITKDLLINQRLLEKWLRVMTVLSLFREFAAYNLNETVVAEVSEKILNDYNPSKWARSQGRKELRQGFAFRHNESSLIPYLQRYLDNFAD